MKPRTIALATVFALLSTFAVAQTGSAGGATTGTTTGANSGGTANRGAGASAIQSDKMNNTTGMNRAPNGAAVNNGTTCDSNSMTNNGCGKTTGPGR